MSPNSASLQPPDWEPVRLYRRPDALPRGRGTNFVEPALARRVDLAAIELSPLLGIRQNRIGGGHSFESLFGLRVSRVEVWVVLLGQLSVRVPDGVLARVTRHAKSGVWVRQFALRSSTCLATCSRRVHAALELREQGRFKRALRRRLTIPCVRRVARPMAREDEGRVLSPVLRDVAVLGEEPSQRRKSGGRQADSAGLAMKADNVERGVFEWSSVRSFFEAERVALTRLPSFPIGSASGADCVDAFTT